VPRTPDCAEVVTVDMVSAEMAKEADSGGNRVKLGESLFPVPGGCWVDWGGLEDGGGDAVCERTVDDVAVWM
jgi:hypothetical protein